MFENEIQTKTETYTQNPNVWHKLLPETYNKTLLQNLHVIVQNAKYERLNNPSLDEIIEIIAQTLTQNFPPQLRVKTVIEFFTYWENLPLSFTLNLLSLSQILGYKHPSFNVRRGFFLLYTFMVDRLNLFAEPEHELDIRMNSGQNKN